MPRKAKESGAAAKHGDNGGNHLTPEERKSLMFHHYRRVVEQKEVLDDAREEYKRLRKEAKADGITLADLDFMIRCAEIDDPAIVPDELKRRAEIAAWFALPVNYQADMFDDRTPLEDRAFEEGKAVGLQGKACESPYDGAPGQKWTEGWHEGQRMMRDDLQSAMEKKNAARREEAPANDDDEAGADVVDAISEAAE